MKRFISFATALIICLGLASCGKNESAEETAEETAVNDATVDSENQPATEVEEESDKEDAQDESTETEEPEDAQDSVDSEEPTDETEEPDDSEPAPEDTAEPDTETTEEPVKEVTDKAETEVPVAPPVTEENKEEQESTAPEAPSTDTPAVSVTPPAPEKQPEVTVPAEPTVPETPIAPVQPEPTPEPAPEPAPAEPVVPEETDKNEENTAMENFKTTYSEYNNYRDPLTHTYKKLTEDKELTVVYFGGSVTAGHGSSDREKYSWRALVGQWLDTNFPEAEITHINRAVGESGTYLGTHRVQLDVIGSEPDLLFLEYSINDKYYGSSYEKAASQYETIVREVKKALPKTDIVTILVTDTGCLFTNKMGKLHTQAQAHEDIAQQYGIPTLHVGRYLAKVANYSTDEFKPKYAIDIVHLTDEGNAVYFECIEEYMHNSLLATDFTNLSDEPKPLIPVVSETLFDGDRTHIQPKKDVYDECVALGSVGIDRNLDRYTGTTSSRGVFILDSTDDLLVFKFTGTELALWCDYYKDDKFLISIDDGEFVEKPGSSHAPAIVASDLEPGEHIIRIKIATDKRLRIGSFFTRDASKATKKGEN